MKKMLSIITVSSLALVSIASVGVHAESGTTGNINGPGTTKENSLNGLHGKDENNFFEATKDQTASAKSTAQFEVTLDDPDQPITPEDKKDKLILEKVPDMNFGHITAKDLISKDNTLQLKDLNVKTENKETFDGNDEGVLKVSDYRLAHGTGWALQVSASDFTANEKASQLKGAKITIGFYKNGESNTTTPDTEQVVLEGAGNQSVVETTKDKTGRLENSYVLSNENTKLELPQQTTVDKGVYQATLTWTLSNTASQDSAF